jgi:hypothetical protein
LEGNLFLFLGYAPTSYAICTDDLNHEMFFLSFVILLSGEEDDDVEMQTEEEDGTTEV